MTRSPLQDYAHATHVATTTRTGAINYDLQHIHEDKDYTVIPLLIRG